MSLFHKKIHDIDREIYIYYPGNEKRTPFKRCSITILLDKCDKLEIENLLNEEGLADFANENEIILSFPVPKESGWNYKLDDNKENDVLAFDEFQNAMIKEDDLPLETDPTGIPTVETMMNTWHPMNDTKYLIGVGSGASMAYTLASCYPDNIAAVLAIDGKLDKEVIKKAVYSPIPICISKGEEFAIDYFIKANKAIKIDENNERVIYENNINKLQSVVLDYNYSELSKQLIVKVWEKMFSRVRRPNTGEHGDVEKRMNIKEIDFEYFIDDTRLDDEKAHTWFTHVPSSLKKQTEKKVPLLMFFHGGSDNPAEAAEMSKFHELGEKEEFITVYPWGTNKCGWNSSMLEDTDDNVTFGSENDVNFAFKLIKYMIDNYQVDPERIYLSGFSNGAAMAQAVALVYPETVTAICPIDSNWPGDRFQASEVNWKDVKPYYLGMGKKKEYDYRIPVWYTYGSREPSYPVYKGCTQQHQYDFWKMYNNIEIKPTPERKNPDPTGCGVKGDKTELLTPSKRHPHHEYDVQRFYSKDKKEMNLYNYVIMREKGHDIAQMDPALGWNYVKQFKRKNDGSIVIIDEKNK